MNITMQTKAVAESNKLHHGGIFGLNSPSNSVVTHMIRQLNQQFKQGSYNAQFFVGDVKCITTRIRLVMHDACVLSFQVIDYSLSSDTTGCLEQNELHFWKRDEGVFSNE